VLDEDVRALDLTRSHFPLALKYSGANARALKSLSGIPGSDQLVK
jgi:hypothetical protein